MNDNNRSYWSGCSRYNSNSKKYQLVVMDEEGKTTLGRICDSFEEVHDAMIELRVLYAKHEIHYHVGYMEVR